MKSKDYEITFWANGFGIWKARADFTIPLGNTSEAEKVAMNAIRQCKKIIRREIKARQPEGAKFRLSYFVSDNDFQLGSGRLKSITISEK